MPLIAADPASSWDVSGLTCHMTWLWWMNQTYHIMYWKNRAAVPQWIRGIRLICQGWVMMWDWRLTDTYIQVQPDTDCVSVWSVATVDSNLWLIYWMKLLVLMLCLAVYRWASEQQLWGGHQLQLWCRGLWPVHRWSCDARCWVLSCYTRHQATDCLPQCLPSQWYEQYRLLAIVA